MHQQPGGKYCGNCQKTVVDFTLMSDADLANFFKKKQGHVCGRFYDDQLDKQIAIPKRALPWLKYFFTITLPAFLYAHKSYGQIEVIKAAIELPDKNPNTSDTNIISIDKSVLTGNVSDEKGEAIPYASVLIKGTKIGTVTDVKGDFYLKVSQFPISLFISAVGYEPNYFVINNENISRIKLFKIRQQLLGDVVTVVKRVKKKSIKKSITKLDSNDFNIFPNPILQNSNLNIRWKYPISSAPLVEIFDAAGNLLQKEMIIFSKNSLDGKIFLKQLPKGFYIIKITDTKTKLILSKEFIIN
jgi:hypothetical protein